MLSMEVYWQLYVTSSIDKRILDCPLWWHHRWYHVTKDWQTTYVSHGRVEINTNYVDWLSQVRMQSLCYLSGKFRKLLRRVISDHYQSSAECSRTSTWYLRTIVSRCVLLTSPMLCQSSRLNKWERVIEACGASVDVLSLIIRVNLEQCCVSHIFLLFHSSRIQEVYKMHALMNMSLKFSFYSKKIFLDFVRHLEDDLSNLKILMESFFVSWYRLFWRYDKYQFFWILTEFSIPSPTHTWFVRIQIFNMFIFVDKMKE